MSPLHVAVLSDREADGGANIAGYRITEALASAGHRLTTIYEYSRPDPRWDSRHLPSGLATHRWSRPARVAATLLPKGVRLDRHHRLTAEALGAVLADVRPDAVLVHNMHIASWSPALLGVASRYAPVVCTLHDTWTFTGRCAYPGDCTQFRSGCTATCPTASEYPPLAPERIATAWQVRRQTLHDGANIAAVSPSRWLAELALSGLWRERPVFTIPYAVDLACFEPLDRALARRALGIGIDERVVLATAADLGNPRKGMHLLFDALRHGVGQPVRVVLMGTPTALPALDASVRTHALGFIANDRLRALAYCAADVFVHPALADNAPLTVIEALACGTPVVAFPVDGLPETTIEGRTGWLAPSVSSMDLLDTIQRALHAVRDGQDLRTSCRAYAESRYAPLSVAQQYEAVFRSLAAGAAAGTGAVQLPPPLTLTP